MKSEKYQISPSYQLIDKRNTNLYQILDVETLKNQTDLILFNVEQQKVYFINESINEFLTLFTQPISKPEITNYYLDNYNTTREEVLPMLQSFFSDMLQQGIIVSAEDYKDYEQYLNISENKIAQQMQDLTADYVIEKTLVAEYPSMMYRARKKSNNTLYVLKVLFLKNKFSKQYLQERTSKMLQERKILEAFIGIHDFLQIVESPTYKNLIINVYEWIDGQSLFTYIRQQEKFSLKQRIGLMTKIINAFATMHSKQVIHGDIHDGNILVDSNGEIKIIDFDMAFLEHESDNQHIILGGMTGFIAPEKIDADYFQMVAACPDFRSEVYQIGVILYYCLYEKMPFEADTWKQLVGKVLAESLEMNQTTKEKEIIPSEILDFVGMALSKKAEYRYKSAIQMLEFWFYNTDFC